MLSVDFASKLPDVPPAGMKEWLMKEFYNSELGGDYCIFNRTSTYVDNVFEQREITTMESYKIGNAGRKHAAECYCTACQSEFVAGWWKKERPNQNYGIKMFVGDDGLNYAGYISEEEITSPDFFNYLENEAITCPYCGEKITLIHKSRLNQYGRTHQLLVTNLEVVDGYAVLMTWLAKRYLTATSSTVDILPREALVIDGKKLHQFSHASFGQFGERRLSKWILKNYKGYDLSFRKYYDYNSNNHRKVLAAVYPFLPDLTGTTGEKTGLYEYMKDVSEGYTSLPFAYILLWRKFPNVENIVKSKWRLILDSELEEQAINNNYHLDMCYGHRSCVMLFQFNKPYQMLGVNKADMRENYSWDWQILSEYHNYLDFIGNISVDEFDGYIDELGMEGVNLIDGMAMDGYEHFGLEEVTNYLWKQYEKYDLQIANGVQILIDYRENLHEIHQDDGISSEEYFPNNLIEAHDRLCNVKHNLIDEAKKRKFELLAEKYKELSFTDGELCIRVAESNQELVDEGHILRHCVGGYGDKHCREDDVIFFVRHYRRPERSYYTLDINFNNKMPYEVQLHGYGNERHGTQAIFSQYSAKSQRLLRQVERGSS